MPHAGTVSIKDGKAVLKIESRFGMEIGRQPQEVQDQVKEITLTPRGDGKLDFHDPGGFFTEPVTLQRQPAKT